MTRRQKQEEGKTEKKNEIRQNQKKYVKTKRQ